MSHEGKPLTNTEEGTSSMDELYTHVADLLQTTDIGLYTGVVAELLQIAEACGNDKKKIEQFQFAVMYAGIAYELDMKKCANKRLLLNAEMLQKRQTLMHQYEGQKDHALRLIFEADLAPLELEEAKLNTVKRIMEIFKFFGAYLKSTMYGFN